MQRSVRCKAVILNPTVFTLFRKIKRLVIIIIIFFIIAIVVVLIIIIVVIIIIITIAFIEVPVFAVIKYRCYHNYFLHVCFHHQHHDGYQLQTAIIAVTVIVKVTMTILMDSLVYPNTISLDS